MPIWIGGKMNEYKDDDRALLQAAYEAAERAYAPYSKFYVGAALLCRDGEVFTGCNIENASYGATLCAERTAFAKALSEGKRKFLKIAVVCSERKTLFPCGICRQFMLEFGDIEVITDVLGQPRSYRLSELIPLGFTEKDLS